MGLESAEDWYNVAWSTYLEAASTGLAACLRAPSRDFAKELVFSCCFEEFEMGWEAEDVEAPFMVEG